MSAERPAPGLIDFHHHVVFDAYRSAIERTGDGTVGGIPLPPWDESSMLERMDALGIGLALVSISAPALAPIAAAQRPGLARACNDEAAELAAAHPSRVGALATLPLPDLDASLAELERALGPLALDGVALLTNYDGRYLADETFTPLLEELDHHGALVHVHPNLPPPMRGARLALPPPVLEFTFDTTRAFADLIARELLDRYPRIRFVLSHLGGALPFLAWRLSMLDAVPSSVDPERPRAAVLEQLRKLSYDTAISAGPENLRLAVELLGPESLVFGSDTPFGPPAFVEANTRALHDAALAAITSGNAQRLLHRQT